MTAHAIARAKERYGLDLTGIEIVAISTACIKGGGMLASTDAGGCRHYILRWAGRIICPVLAPLGAVVTFEPADAYTSGSSLKRAKKRLGKGHKRPGKGPKSRRKTWGY